MKPLLAIMDEYEREEILVGNELDEGISVEKLLYTIYKVIPYASRMSTMEGTPLVKAMRALDRLDEALRLKRGEREIEPEGESIEGW